jgi:hypothetical protein
VVGGDVVGGSVVGGSVVGGSVVGGDVVGGSVVGGGDVVGDDVSGGRVLGCVVAGAVVGELDGGVVVVGAPMTGGRSDAGIVGRNQLIGPASVDPSDPLVTASTFTRWAAASRGLSRLVGDGVPPPAVSMAATVLVPGASSLPDVPPTVPGESSDADRSSSVVGGPAVVPFSAMRDPVNSATPTSNSATARTPPPISVGSVPSSVARRDPRPGSPR